MTKIKICGITNLRDLEIVTNTGVNAFGVIVEIPSSPRSINREKAKKLIEKSPLFISSVSVIAPESLEEALEICDYIKPDAVQIHKKGFNIREFSESTSGIRVIKPVSAFDLRSFLSESKILDYCDAILVDSSTSNQLGGTGKIHDWNMSRRIRETINPKPMILAGGLSPENVKEAIETVKPYAVDACTGTEGTPGIKDPHKVREFISAVRETERRYFIE
jgi:phosphoribosylanthranilate isomerase